MSIGNNIKTAREKAGITQKQLSEKIGRGFSTIQKYEMGIITPPIKTIFLIANALNVDPEWLISSRPQNLLEWDETPDCFKDIDGILGKNIQACREKKGMSLSEFSAKIHCEEPYVKEIEDGEEYPNSNLCLKISEVLGVQLSELLPPRYQNTSIIEYSNMDLIDDEMLKINCAAVSSYMEKMNRAGQAVAVQTVKTLADMPEYQKKDEPGQE